MITPCSLPCFITAIRGHRSLPIIAATSMIVSSALAAGSVSWCCGSSSRTVLPPNISAARSATDSASTPASSGIVLHVTGHDEAHYLRGRQHRIQLPVRSHYDDPGQAVFGKHPGGFQGRRVDVHHRELLRRSPLPARRPRARYFTRASGALAPTAVEDGSRYRDRATGRGLMLTTTEWTMDINAACARLAIRTRALAVS